MTQQKIFTLSVLIGLFFMSTALAQDENKRQIPEGMEEIQLEGSAKLIVPKGAKTRKMGAQIIVEGTKEYMARRIFELENELTELEKKQSELQNEVNTLKSTVKNIQDKINLNNSMPATESPTAKPSPNTSTLIPSVDVKGKKDGTN